MKIHSTLGRLAVLSSPGSENWYHWLLQVLPRLIILKASHIQFDRIYINNLQFDWQKKALDIFLQQLDIPQDKLLIINGDCVIQAETLIVPSVPFIPSKGMPFPMWLKAALRRFFNATETATTSPKMLYISRKNASSRRIKNEDALTKQLKDLGFEIVFLENLTPQQQAQLFHNARLVVGPHGSGFANLVFSKPGMKLIEIDHGATPPRDLFKRLSEMLGIDYMAHHVGHVEEEAMDDDITLEIDKLIPIIKRHIDL